MQRKTDTIELDIPKDDIECWEKYPKYRWVYELSRLLDAQNIKWSPYNIPSLPDRELNIDFETTNTAIRQPGYIYMKKLQGQHLVTEVHIMKGEIKNIRHFDPITDNELESLVGEIELRINAFVTLYFQKFTGTISAETYSNEIVRIRLKPHVALVNETNVDVVKLVKRIYKRTDITFNGLTDQALRESLTS